MAFLGSVPVSEPISRLALLFAVRALPAISYWRGVTCAICGVCFLVINGGGIAVRAAASHMRHASAMEGQMKRLLLAWALAGVLGLLASLFFHKVDAQIPLWNLSRGEQSTN